MQLAGVAALTLPPTLLSALSNMQESETTLVERSLFQRESKVAERETERRSFLKEAEFRDAFSKSDGGKGQLKTKQVPSNSYASRWHVGAP